MQQCEIEINPEYKKYVHEKIFNFINEYKSVFMEKDPVFVCIGTPNAPGDAVGPLIGTILSSFGYKVYGTIQKPVNALNVSRVNYRLWFRQFLNAPIIAIDASVSEAPIGHISCIIGEGISPGKALDKNLCDIGNSCIKVTTSNTVAGIWDTNKEIDAIARVIAYSIHCEMLKYRTM